MPAGALIPRDDSRAHKRSNPQTEVNRQLKARNKQQGTSGKASGSGSMPLGGGTASGAILPGAAAARRDIAQSSLEARAPIPEAAAAASPPLVSPATAAVAAAVAAAAAEAGTALEGNRPASPVQARALQAHEAGGGSTGVHQPELSAATVSMPASPKSPSATPGELQHLMV